MVVVVVSRSIVIAVSARYSLCAVEEDAHLLESLVLVEHVDFRYGVLFEQTRADHEDCAVHVFLYYLRVDNYVHRRTVEEHVVVFAGGFL